MDIVIWSDMYKVKYEYVTGSKIKSATCVLCMYDGSVTLSWLILLVD